MTVTPRIDAPPMLTPMQSAYSNSLALALIICWSPAKGLAYFAPVIALIAIIVGARESRVLLRAAGWFFGFALLISVYTLAYDAFIPLNAVIFMLTSGTFAFLFAMPSDLLGGDQTAFQERIERICRWFVVVEGSLGIVQAFAGYLQNGFLGSFNGDFVKGTIDPIFARDSAFSNPMFATNMTFLLIFLLPSLLTTRKGLLSFLTGVFALVLASVVHVIIFTLAALFLAVLIYRPPVFRWQSVVGLASLLLIPYLTAALLTDNLATFGILYAHFQANESPRSKIIGRALLQMPVEYPLLPFVGLGPGQFTSRAGLISTGLFFGNSSNLKSIPLVTPRVTDSQQTFLIDLWLEDIRDPYEGSTSRPYFSVLAAFTEFGAAGLLLPFLIGARMLWLAYVAGSASKRMFATAFGATVLVLLLLGFQENYWEVPQAIFIGCMLAKVMFSSLRFDDEPESPSANAIEEASYA